MKKILVIAFTVFMLSACDNPSSSIVDSSVFSLESADLDASEEIISTGISKALSAPNGLKISYRSSDIEFWASSGTFDDLHSNKYGDREGANVSTEISLSDRDDNVVFMPNKVKLSDYENDASPDMLKSITDFYLSNGKRISLLIGPGGDSGFIEKLKNVIYKDFNFGEVVPDTPEVSVIFEFGLYGLLMSFNRWYQIKDKLDVEAFIEIARSIISNGIPHTLKSLYIPEE